MFRKLSSMLFIEFSLNFHWTCFCFLDGRSFKRDKILAPFYFWRLCLCLLNKSYFHGLSCSCIHSRVLLQSIVKNLYDKKIGNVCFLCLFCWFISFFFFAHLSLIFESLILQIKILIFFPEKVKEKRKEAKYLIIRNLRLFF